MLFKSLFLILSYECVPVTRLVEPVLVIDTGLARLDFAHLAHPPLLTSAPGQRALPRESIIVQVGGVGWGGFWC